MKISTLRALSSMSLEEALIADIKAEVRQANAIALGADQALL